MNDSWKLTGQRHNKKITNLTAFYIECHVLRNIKRSRDLECWRGVISIKQRCEGSGRKSC